MPHKEGRACCGSWTCSHVVPPLFGYRGAYTPAAAFAVGGVP